MKLALCATLACPAAALAAGQLPVLQEFAGLATGTVVSSQYAGLTFTANAFSGGTWATNTDMRVAFEGSDLAPGAIDPGDKVLHTYTGWLAENGDPSFRIAFTDGALAFEARFAFVFPAAETAASTALYAYNGATLLGTVNATGARATNPVLSWAGSFAAPITSVVVTPGSRYDYVAVDNIIYTLVPEPASFGLMSLGLVVLGIRKQNAPKRRR